MGEGGREGGRKGGREGGGRRNIIAISVMGSSTGCHLCRNSY